MKMPDTHEPVYRWSHPIKWLRDTDDLEYNDLINFIAKNCDGDQIQDYFQADMDEDGYFEDLDAPKEDEEEEDGEA